MNRTNRRGFTLVEVVITVSIIGILLAIAIPNMVGYRKGAEREGCQDQMRSILSAIEEARLERDYDVLTAVQNSGTIDALVTGTSGGNYKNKYLPESFGCPSGGGAYSISYDSDSDTWTVTCPNAASKGHTL
jgi:prepilin-type N-terminal cleavage/methylation domain-containing protein